MIGGHGHVIPRPDGGKARCGGPRICHVCAAERTRLLEQAPEQIASEFHRRYELFAPTVGYNTRDESAVPWEQVPETNRQLMVMVVRDLIRGDVITPGPATITSIETPDERKRRLDDAMEILRRLPGEAAAGVMVDARNALGNDAPFDDVVVDASYRALATYTMQLPDAPTEEAGRG